MGIKVRGAFTVIEGFKVTVKPPEPPAPTNVYSFVTEEGEIIVDDNNTDIVSEENS
jgi:hypothetical protein